MRVGMLCPYSLTLPGGVQMQVLGLARAVRRQGHDVRVLAPCDGPPPEVGVIPLGQSVPAAANGSVAPLAPDPSAQLRTIRALRDEDFDVIHVHEPLAPGPAQTTLLLKTAPLIGTFHAAGESAGYKYLRPLVRWLAGRLDVRCAVSEQAAALAQRYLEGSYLPVFNGIDVELHAGAEPWPSDGPTLFFVGRHEPRKGLDVLLEAMDHLPGDVRLWVAGDGPDTAELRARHGSDRIEWLGRISDDEKLRRIRGASVFCAPALRGESFGIVLLEGMAAGTPVVAGDIDGYRTVATDGLDAILAPPGDAAALASAVERVLAGGPAIEAMVEAGRQRAAHHSLDRLAALYLEQYEGLRSKSA
jgi:phosphatidylinositol alpha-mannosyltransferase